MINIGDIERVIQQHPEVFNGLKHRVKKDFEEWYPDNMHVIEAFEKEALYLKKYGKRERYSVYTIREKLRWDSLLSENSPEDYKLNNNYSPCIARILMHVNPVMQGMFALRQEQEREMGKGRRENDAEGSYKVVEETETE